MISISTQYIPPGDGQELLLSILLPAQPSPAPAPPSLDVRLVRSEVPRDAQLYQLSNKNTDGSCEVLQQKPRSCLFL